MKQRQRFDEEKAIEVLLYIVQQCSDTYTALKVMFFADKEHLANYGRFICGDEYVAMQHGPVPSGMYDIVKAARPGSDLRGSDNARLAIDVLGNTVTPKREPNMAYLSESEVECIDESITRYGWMDFGQLKAISHLDPAYQAADENDFMALEEIAKTLPDGEALLEYLSID